MKRKFVAAIVVLAIIVGGAVGWLKTSARFNVSGTIRLPALDEPVRVLRDAAGVPYVFANNTADLFRAQGLVTAQHRLFQLEAYRAIFGGELAAAIGEPGLASDIRMRVFGIRRNARRHAQLITGQSRRALEWFAEGLNAYITDYPDDHPVEFSLAPFRTGPWSVEDLVSVVHHIHFRQSVNYKTEVLAQRLIDHLGLEKARQIAPVHMNPDREHGAQSPAYARKESAALQVGWGDLVTGAEDLDASGFGSNNWVVAPGKSASGHAIVANDPHLDARILPGIWHPIGLFTLEISAVGAALPGMPGILSGRTANVAFGVTNSYGDVQDLYLESIDPADPGRYLDGANGSQPFRTSVETIAIRDDDAPDGFRYKELKIRFTRRGPVLTEHGLGPDGDTLIVLRMTSAETRSETLGAAHLLAAKNVEDFDRALADINLLMFNFVFADTDGRIGQRATGAVPRRMTGDGSIPRRAPVDGSDDWIGFIPKNRMPGGFDPPRGWLATANHDTRPDDYPYYYSSHFAPSYRYRRAAEALEAAGKMTVEDHWTLIRDDRNLQSDRLLPLVLRVLQQRGVDAEISSILARWDGVDVANSPAPLVYQTIYRHLALATFADELGEELAHEMLSTWYFWQERFDAMVASNSSSWFDDTSTVDRIETFADLVVVATARARRELVEQYGAEPAAWRWGRAHRISFTSPLRRRGFGHGWLGAGTHAVSGSRDTLKSGSYDFGSDYSVKSHDSLRMVADLGDPEKITAVVPGGVVGRQFHPHQSDQVRPWLDGELRYWWFSRAAIEHNAVAEQLLTP